jgi:signal transduction histidine kinase
MGGTIRAESGRAEAGRGDGGHPGGGTRIVVALPLHNPEVAL